MPKNYAFFQKLLDKFFYKFYNPEINCQEIFPASFKNIENREGFFTHADVVNAQSWKVSTPKNPVEPP